MIRFEIPGEPIPLKRHRTSNGKTYDPSKDAKRNFAWLVKQRSVGLFPHAEAIKVVIEYHMPIPQSYSNRKRLNAIGRPHTKKPDLTNLAKFTEDALNHILWKDDAIIADLHVKKIYSEEPKTLIMLEKIK